MQKFNHPNAVKWFMDLVQVDSETFAESPLADYIEKAVKKLKWDCKVIREKINLAEIPENIKRRNPTAVYEGETENIYVVFPATDTTKPTIFFSSHMDTVTPGKACKPVITDDGIIKTDGTSVLGADDKAGLAEIFAGIQLILENKIPHGKIVVVGTAMEEIGLVGSKMSEKVTELGIEYGYVLDMNDRIGTVVTRTLHTQFLTIDLVYDGPKMHGAGAYGENTISYAAEIVRMIPRGLFSNDRYASISVSNMTFSSDEGFRSPNKAQIKANCASLYEDDMLMYRNMIGNMLDHHTRDRLTLTYKFTPEKTLGYCIYDTAKGTELVKSAEKIITDMGIEFKNDKSRGGFDANEFALKGIPTLVLSCGFMENHTVNEYIVEQDLHDGAELVKRLIAEAK